MGDRQNTKVYRKDSRPFENRKRESCPGYLYAMLDAANLNPTDVHLMNAFKISGEPHASLGVLVLEPRIIVALGNNALHWCHAQLYSSPEPYRDRVPLLHYPHPAHLRRFWHHFAPDFGYSLGCDIRRCDKLLRTT